jgi:hypothetical protein
LTLFKQRRNSPRPNAFRHIESYIVQPFASLILRTFLTLYAHSPPINAAHDLCCTCYCYLSLSLPWSSWSHILSKPRRRPYVIRLDRLTVWAWGWWSTFRYGRLSVTARASIVRSSTTFRIRLSDGKTSRPRTAVLSEAWHSRYMLNLLLSLSDVTDKGNASDIVKPLPCRGLILAIYILRGFLRFSMCRW